MTVTTATKLFIGGEWVDSTKHLEVTDPATSELLAVISSASLQDGLDAVTAAHNAFHTWATTPARQRAEILRYWQRWVRTQWSVTWQRVEWSLRGD